MGLFQVLIFRMLPHCQMGELLYAESLPMKQNKKQTFYLIKH
nr:MAG TPA: hypothetical protein [Caudoviricetes sp.]